MKLRTLGLTMAVSSLILAAACGGGSPDASGDGASHGGGNVETAANDRGQDAKAKKARCPAKVNKALTGPDIAGFRLGMTFEEAEATLACHMPDGVTTYDNAFFNMRSLDTGTLRLEKQKINAQTGESQECDFRNYTGMQSCGAGNRQWSFTAEKISLATPGVSGNQKVHGIWRSQYWKDGEMPAASAVEAALLDKYGQPQMRGDQSDPYRGRDIRLYWVWDEAGNPLGEAHPMRDQCANGVRPRGDDSQLWRGGCGLSITAMVKSSRNNPEVVEELSIGMFDQNGLYEYGETFQNELTEIENQRRSQELEKAQNTKIDL